MEIKHCPGCHNEMHLKKFDRKTTIKGITVTYPSEMYVCPECGLESGTIEQASMVQKLIADAYRKKVRLLTGDEIRNSRKEKGYSSRRLGRED